MRLLSKEIIISFDPTNNIDQEEMLNEKIEEYLMILGPFQPTNKVVTIICGSQKFSFDQSWLAKISTVFSEMFENCDVGNPEFKMDGDKPESFTTLKNLSEKKIIKVLSDTASQSPTCPLCPEFSKSWLRLPWF